MTRDGIITTMSDLHTCHNFVVQCLVIDVLGHRKDMVDLSMSRRLPVPPERDITPAAIDVYKKIGDVALKALLERLREEVQFIVGSTI